MVPVPKILGVLPYLPQGFGHLTMLVLKFETYFSLPVDIFKNCWMTDTFYSEEPDQMPLSVSTLFAQVFLSKYF